jgi:hypothetical protein
MIDSTQHEEKSFDKTAHWKPKKDMHHGDQQTSEIIPDKCQETHNAHTQE